MTFRLFAIAAFAALAGTAVPVAAPTQTADGQIADGQAAGSAIADDLAGLGISQIRIGAMDHDVYPGWIPFDPSQWKLDGIEDVNLEVLFNLPDTGFVRTIGSPKLNVGGTASLTGRTSFAHLALTWQMPVATTPLFIEGSIGGAIHNGDVGPGPGRNFGCRTLFYTSAGLGLNVTDNAYVMASYEHISNAGLCSPNPGLSNFGVKLGVNLD